MNPLVSIIILNYFHPEVIDVCLRHLQKYTEIPHEVVVVDNGSDQNTIDYLREQHRLGLIDVLVENGYNALFSEGNNIGVQHSDPESEYLLFLNSDVAVIHDQWLDKLLSWIEGEANYWPNPWCSKVNHPKGGPLDILSAGWSHDINVEGNARPEGFCLMMRRKIWRPFDTNFPWLYGWEHTVSEIMRDGARCGVLFNYSKYLVHRESASGKPPAHEDASAPDLGGWFAGLEIETLDFTLGPDEHSSYLEW